MYVCVSECVCGRDVVCEQTLILDQRSGFVLFLNFILFHHCLLDQTIVNIKCVTGRRGREKVDVEIIMEKKKVHYQWFPKWGA